MSYTPPSGNAANASWVDAPAYIPPAGNAANVTWLVGTSGGVTGSASGTVALIGSGSGTHSAPVIQTVEGTGSVSLLVAAVGQGMHGVAGIASGAVDCTGAGTGAHGVAGVASSALSIAGSGVAVHERYELRGEVREGGVLVNRRVRAYLRITGAFVSEADTIVGRFAVKVGFTPAEHYVTPIDLRDIASDWLPPTANRIVPVLAYDTV
jgi:hypothetical protein